MLPCHSIRAATLSQFFKFFIKQTFNLTHPSRFRNFNSFKFIKFIQNLSQRSVKQRQTKFHLNFTLFSHSLRVEQV